MTDEALIRRAIRLAMNGRGRVEPNPMVGCVLARDGRVIGEGYHQQFGGPHAEPNALADCAARGESPEGATAYVSLEPCCHEGKKTPPCAPRLIAAKVARVVIGCLDPNPQVNGNGVAMLRAAGIRVDGPVLEGEAKQLIAPFLARVKAGRPYVTLKWAQAADGKVAGPGGRRMQISGPASSRLVHQLRARSDAIMVGINTVLADDPLLTARGVEEFRKAQRVVLDTNLLIPRSAALVRSADGDVVVLCSASAERFKPDTVEALRAAGVGVCAGWLGEPPTRTSLSDIVADELFRNASHVLVEPGPTLARAFFADGAADRAWVFRSARRVDDVTSPSAADVPGDFVVTGKVRVGDDALTEYLNPRSAAFFAPVPSADFVLAAEAATSMS